VDDVVTFYVLAQRATIARRPASRDCAVSDARAPPRDAARRGAKKIPQRIDSRAPARGHVFFSRSSPCSAAGFGDRPGRWKKIRARLTINNVDGAKVNHQRGGPAHRRLAENRCQTAATCGARRSCPDVKSGAVVHFVKLWLERPEAHLRPLSRKKAPLKIKSANAPGGRNGTRGARGWNTRANRPQKPLADCGGTREAVVFQTAGSKKPSALGRSR